MVILGAATGQFHNRDQIKILPQSETPPHHAPLQVPVVEAVPGFALKPNFIEAHWPPRLASVHTRVSTLASLHLSAFGRAFAISTYAISKMLYHVEYMGLPPRDMIDRVISRYRWWVDHGHWRCRATGMPYIAMTYYSILHLRSLLWLFSH
jgi:hypothetical protein